MKGLLLSKVYGGIHCILSVHLKDGASDLNFKVIGYNVLLEPSICAHFYTTLFAHFNLCLHTQLIDENIHVEFVGKN